MSRNCALAPFHSVIDELIIRGQTFKKIEDHIRNKGYSGSASAIRMYATKKRRLIQQLIESDMDKYDLVDRRHLIKLLYKPIDKIKDLSLELLNRIISEYPILSNIYNILSSLIITLH